MKILVDAFGGDNAPLEVVKGSVEALKENKDFVLSLVGDEDKINEILGGLTYDKTRVEIIDAKEVITCEEEPTLAIRRKANSTIVVGLKTLKENEDYSAFISSGSTGAFLVGATLKLGRIKGVSRPALCPILPRLDGKKVLLLDAGANADCKPQNLVEFALMGTEFARLNFGIENPKVYLLSNGTEDKKGNMLNLETFPMLKENAKINFIGNMEARDLLSSDADIVVADGFSGNIALKSYEGAVNTVLKALKSEIMASTSAKIGYLFMKKAFNNLRATLDYSSQGGAIFLGTQKVIVKTHGSAKAKTFKNAVLQAIEVAKSGVVEKMKEDFSINSEE
ncbi:MAG: phosphate acyltransferase PlsX [Clostridia bacterium]|nr:phosphate acyltransferase PlsX [Clostridia bacterium]